MQNERLECSLKMEENISEIHERRGSCTFKW